MVLLLCGHAARTTPVYHRRSRLSPFSCVRLAEQTAFSRVFAPVFVTSSVCCLSAPVSFERFFCLLPTTLTVVDFVCELLFIQIRLHRASLDATSFPNKIVFETHWPRISCIRPRTCGGSQKPETWTLCDYFNRYLITLRSPVYRVFPFVLQVIRCVWNQLDRLRPMVNYITTTVLE